MKKFVFLVIIIVIVLMGVYFYENKSVISNTFKYDKDMYLYTECMKNEFSEVYLEKLKSIEYDGSSIYFRDLTNNYEFFYNKDELYYSASTIKLLEVIYIGENNIDINKTLVYEPKHARVSSIGMKTHKYYESVSIKDMVSYILKYSDNTAHYMLVEYLGASTLNEYFKEYNIYLTESVPFINNFSLELAANLLDRVYKLMDNTEYGIMLRESMNNDFDNYLNFSDVKFLHKYGLYDVFYHDLGIYDNSNPFFIAVLSTYGYNLEKTTEISKKIYEVYEENKEAKKEYCKKMAGVVE